MQKNLEKSTQSAMEELKSRLVRFNESIMNYVHETEYMGGNNLRLTFSDITTPVDIKFNTPHIENLGTWLSVTIKDSSGQEIPLSDIDIDSLIVEFESNSKVVFSSKVDPSKKYICEASIFPCDYSEGFLERVI